LGPQADKIQHTNVMKFIEEGKKSGAKVVTGGARQGTKGYFVQPTIFRDVNPQFN
jgi:aldehyde dehydrogenase (NAD+)